MLLLLGPKTEQDLAPPPKKNEAKLTIKKEEKPKSAPSESTKSENSKENVPSDQKEDAGSSLEELLSGRSGLLHKVSYASFILARQRPGTLARSFNSKIQSQN